jgi:hypothetical protein
MTSAAIVQPSKVRALIVGIEKYQAGPEYDLDGPSGDALKFASWLLDRGVDPEHIYLFLSPLDENREKLSEAEALGLKPLPAIHDLISAKIRSQLTNEYGQGGDLLYVFWSGHGIVTKTDTLTRRLLFADTDDDTKWNLNFNSLVEGLSTFAHGAGFNNQAFFIDACANAYYQGLFQTVQGEAAEVKFAASGEIDRGDQFVLFASAEYEVATNESDIGTGSFAKALFDSLKDQPLFPDMPTITETVQIKFKEKQKLEPVYWWRKQRGNEEEVDNRERTSLKEEKSPQMDIADLQPNRKLPSVKQIKLKSMQKQQEILIKQYEAASNQLVMALAAADKIIIEEQINFFEQRLMALEEEITKIVSP